MREMMMQYMMLRDGVDTVLDSIVVNTTVEQALLVLDGAQTTLDAAEHVSLAADLVQEVELHEALARPVATVGARMRAGLTVAALVLSGKRWWRMRVVPLRLGLGLGARTLPLLLGGRAGVERVRSTRPPHPWPRVGRRGVVRLWIRR